MRYKKLTQFFLIIFTFVILIYFIQLWLRIYFISYDIDINTGRIRTTRNFLTLTISSKIEDLILTETIGMFGEDVQPDWQRVNTFSPGVRHSPHYRYHGAIHQIHVVDMILRSHDFSDEAKRYIAQTVLKQWQTQGDYFGIDKYLNDLWNIAEQRAKSDPNIIISVADLSSVPVE